MEQELLRFIFFFTEQSIRLAKVQSISRRFDWKCEPDCSVESVFDPLHRSSHPNNVYTLTPSTTQNPTTAPTLAWLLSLLLLLAIKDMLPHS